MPEDILVSEAMDWLNDKLTDFRSQRLEVLNHYSHFWRYATPNRSLCGGRVVADAQDKVALVGDWLNGGRIEGAYLSAIELADHYF